MGNVREFVSKNPKERNYLGDQVVDEKINIKLVVKEVEWRGTDWIRLVKIWGSVADSS